MKQTLPEDKKFDALQKVKIDLFTCVDDMRNKNLTEVERAIARKMAKAYFAAYITLHYELFGVGLMRGELFTIADLPHETMQTPVIAINAKDLVDLGLKVAEIAEGPEEMFSIVSVGGEIRALVARAENGGKVEIFKCSCI